MSVFRTLLRDFRACRDRDPALRGPWAPLEVWFCYAGWHAIFWHRVCHFLHATLRVPVLPRFLAQCVRMWTQIEIHPGARIGAGFFIDHGAGVVIGETAEIGRNVTLYQGVTLGGTGKERGKRHPTLHDGVVVGAGAQVLGNIVVGAGARVGAGSVVVRDVAPHTTVVGVPAREAGVRPAPQAALDHRALGDPLGERLCAVQEELEKVARELDQLRGGDHAAAPDGARPPAATRRPVASSQHRGS